MIPYILTFNVPEVFLEMILGVLLLLVHIFICTYDMYIHGIYSEGWAALILGVVVIVLRVIFVILVAPG